MTKTETQKIIAVMLATYPNYKPFDVELTVDTWTEMLEEYTYQQVSLALKEYIKGNTSSFAPTIGQLVDLIYNAANESAMGEAEAWTLVSNAIRNSAYHAVEEYDNLPPAVQKAVGMPSQLRTWATDENYNEEVVMSHFVRCYRTEVQREKEFAKMPPKMQDMISKVNENSLRTMLEQKRKQAIETTKQEKKREFEEARLIETTVKNEMPAELKEKLKQLSATL